MGSKMSNSEFTTLDQPEVIDPRLEEMEDRLSRERLLARVRLFGTNGGFFCALRSSACSWRR